MRIKVTAKRKKRPQKGKAATYEFDVRDAINGLKLTEPTAYFLPGFKKQTITWLTNKEFNEAKLSAVCKAPNLSVKDASREEGSKFPSF